MAKGVSLGSKTGATGDGVLTGGTGATNNLWLYGNDSETGTVYIGGLPVMGHVTRPQEWAHAAGAHFWAQFGNAGELTAASPAELAAQGWITTNLSAMLGSGADFGSAADDDPTGFDFNASGDLLQSARRFGNYGHMLLAQEFLGAFPTALSMEAYASFPTATANENSSGFGFSTDTPATITNHVAFIQSNGTNFRMRTQGDADIGAAIDTAWHKWKIRIDTNIEWWIDGVSQGSTILPTDIFPTSFAAHTLTTNRLQLSWLHVWYSAD